MVELPILRCGFILMHKEMKLQAVFVTLPYACVDVISHTAWNVIGLMETTIIFVFIRVELLMSRCGYIVVHREMKLQAHFLPVVHGAANTSWKMIE